MIMTSNIEYILHCFTNSDEELAKDIKENIDDYENILTDYILPFITYKEVNIGIIGMGNVGKTSFIKSLDGVLDIHTNEYSVYKIYRDNIIINMHEFSSKNMYKIMNKKYNMDGLILMVDNQRISYFYGLTWFQEMYKNTGNIPYIFLHNKVDENVESLFDSMYHTWNISAKNKYGTVKALENLIEKI